MKKLCVLGIVLLTVAVAQQVVEAPLSKPSTAQMIRVINAWGSYPSIESDGKIVVFKLQDAGADCYIAQTALHGYSHGPVATISCIKR